jgi:hypothetical protein
VSGSSYRSSRVRESEARRGSPCRSPPHRPVGTRVVISGITKQPEGRLGEAALDRLISQLALYIEKYHPTVIYNGTTLDPSAIQVARKSYELSEHDALLNVIEWTKPFPRALYLCSSEGMALADVPPGIQAPGFSFTAYLQWPGFADDAIVLTAELDPVSGALIEAAREQLRQHFKERAEVERRTQVAQWKSENVYPFDEEPPRSPRGLPRTLFDVVAVTARATVNAAETSSKRAFAKPFATGSRREPQFPPQGLPRGLGAA